MENSKLDQINSSLLLKYTNFEYLLFKKHYSDLFPKALLKSLFLNPSLKYDKQTINKIWTSLLPLLTNSPSPAIEQQFNLFLETLNDNSHNFEHKNPKEECSHKKSELDPQTIFQMNPAEFKIDESPMVNERYNPENPKDKPFICSMFTLLRTSIDQKESINIKKKVEKKSIRLGLQEVNIFVTDLIKFSKGLRIALDNVDAREKDFFMMFICLVLYKDKYYNLLVNKTGNLKKISFIWKYFEKLKKENEEIILFKYLKNATPKKIEEKLCRTNKKLKSILKAIENNNKGIDS